MSRFRDDQVSGLGGVTHSNMQYPEGTWNSVFSWTPPTDKQLTQRQKQIDIGKKTEEYAIYRNRVPIGSRDPSYKWTKHPVTPNKHRVCSKRAFEGEIHVWRRCLHSYVMTPPSSAVATKECKEEELEEGEIRDVEQVKRASAVPDDDDDGTSMEDGEIRTAPTFTTEKAPNEHDTKEDNDVTGADDDDVNSDWLRAQVLEAAKQYHQQQQPQPQQPQPQPQPQPGAPCNKRQKHTHTHTHTHTHHNVDGSRFAAPAHQRVTR